MPLVSMNESGKIERVFIDQDEGRRVYDDMRPRRGRPLRHRDDIRLRALWADYVAYADQLEGDEAPASNRAA
jgi:hypothetical protein